MNNKLSKSAQSVQDVLDQKDITTNVVELPASTRTAQDAAAAIGCSIGQIVKSLIFKVHDSDTPILVLASGPNRVNEAMIERVVGHKIVKADADFTRAVTGFAIGGIPPIGHKQPIMTLIDEDLMKFDHVWAAAGTPNAVFTIAASDLTTLTHGQIVTIH
jgi:prolyl-tRNA editing enzyme YbaK/EbsC (Cys-tRNA(Pro) deacylase)